MSAIESFKAFASELGIDLPEPINTSGDLHRPLINGKRDVAYRLHLDDCPAAYLEDFKRGIKTNWKYTGEFKQFSAEERKAYKLRAMKEQEQHQRETLAKKHQAAIRARSIWREAGKLYENHPYLTRKQILPHNARVQDGSIIVPIYNRYKQLVSLQFILEDGSKRFLKDGELKGCFGVIGGTLGQTLGICEGFATAASIHEPGVIKCSLPSAQITLNRQRVP